MNGRQRSEIIVEDHTDEFARQMHAAAKRALDEAAEVGVQTAHAVPSGYRIAAIQHAVIKSGVEQTSRGLGVWLIAPDWRSIFFELGTYRRRKRKLKQARRSNRPNMGVRPVYFLSKAHAYARDSLPAFLKHEARKIRL